MTSKVADGAEPFYHEGGRVGVLIAHGFTGTPQALRFLAEGLARAGYTVAMPRLTGHGTTTTDMAAATARDWTNDIMGAIAWLKQRCDTIFMTGLSMGGTLALWVAAQYPDLLAGIIPINGAVILNSPDLASLVFMPGAPPVVPGVGGDIKAPGVQELAYPVIPVPAVPHLLLLMKVVEEMLPRIKAPALIIESRTDHVVPPINAEMILNRINSLDKRVLWLENSYHVATLDHDKERVLMAMLDFIKQHS